MNGGPRTTQHEGAGEQIHWPLKKMSLIQARGRTYLSVGDLLAYVGEVETDSDVARQVLDGLVRQIASLL